MAIDFDFIRKLEGFETSGYIPKDKKGNILGQSGVTIGSGIDLGQWTEKQLLDMGVDFSVIAKLKPYLGKKKDAADKLLQQQPLQLGSSEAEDLTEAVKQHFANKVSDWYDKNNNKNNRFSSLPDGVQTAITSVSFQYGIGLDKTPNFKKQVLDNNWNDMLANLRNFGDDYETRRNQEADLLSQTLGSRAPQSPVKDPFTQPAPKDAPTSQNASQEVSGGFTKETEALLNRLSSPSPVSVQPRPPKVEKEVGSDALVDKLSRSSAAFSLKQGNN